MDEVSSLLIEDKVRLDKFSKGGNLIQRININTRTFITDSSSENAVCRLCRIDFTHRDLMSSVVLLDIYQFRTEELRIRSIT